MKKLLVFISLLSACPRSYAQCPSNFYNGLNGGNTPTSLKEYFKIVNTAAYVVKYYDIGERTTQMFSSSTSVVVTQIKLSHLYQPYFGVLCGKDTVWQVGSQFKSHEVDPNAPNCVEQSPGSVISSRGTATFTTPLKSDFVLCYNLVGGKPVTVMGKAGTATVSGLTIGASYLFNIRMKCANNIYSDYTTPGFFRCK